MKAIEIKKQLDKNIAFYYGEKYEQDILDAIDELSFYIYDNDDHQVGRLKNIELLDIAKQFARDISEGLEISKENKNKVNDELANIIIASNSFEYPRKFVEQKLSKIKELKQNYLNHVEEFLKVLEYFQHDYQVKKIMSKIDNSYNLNKTFEMETVKIKREILCDTFNIKDNIDYEEVIQLWNLLDAFNPNLENLNIYKSVLDKQKKIFYMCIGCKGNELVELMLDASIKGVLVDDNMYFKCSNDYLQRFDELAKKYYFGSSNLEEIFNDLDRNGYYVDEKSISTFLIETDNLCGVNFPCSDEYSNETSFIVYNNNEYLYTKDFNETFIHEIVHYIGGNNPNIFKKGLHYNNDVRYLNLEEAYTNYVSKQITKLYQEKYPDLISSNDDRKLNAAYDCTLPYMEKVFELYKDELFQIHLSTSISEQDACVMLPFSEIADAVVRIKEAGTLAKAITNDELNKLSRRAKR